MEAKIVVIPARDNRTVAAQRATTAPSWSTRALDLAALHQRVNITPSLSLFEAVFGCELRHKIAIALERGQILFGEFAPLRLDFLEDDLLGVAGGRRARIGSNICHLSLSTI